MMQDYSALYSLSGKNALVTGGMGLLGWEICRAMASMKAKTIVLDIDSDRAEKAVAETRREGLDMAFEYFDVTDLDNADENIGKLWDKYGALHVWVNSAYPRTSDWGYKVEDLSLDSWRKNVDMHLNSYAWISRRAAMVMKDQGGGAIINMSSIYGVVGNDFTVYEGSDMTGPMAYAAIKGGIVNLSRYMASYFGPYNVRVNAVCPGGILDNQASEFIAKYSDKTPLKRMGAPSEIASVTAFLASDAASYISGAAIMVDGGWTAI